MNVIQANCRAQFTPADMEFILSVLGEGKEESLSKLLTDPGSIDVILDDEGLFRTILEKPGFLGISSHLYFYVLVRHVLRYAGIERRSVADYVAGMLAEFSSAHRARRIKANDPNPVDYLVDMLAALHCSDEQTRFLIRVHVGNHSLFLSGVFPERVRFQAMIRAAPEMAYYEQMGSANYRMASNHQLARRMDLALIFQTLSDAFHVVRIALNELSDRLIALSEPEGLHEVLMDYRPTER